MTKKSIKIGIIGGLGPLASASFLETLYATYLNEPRLKEHYHPPYVYLYSEPLLSQSTAVMSLTHSETELLAKLEKNITLLLHQEVDRIIICCFTAHALLPKLLPSQQAKICSLVTLVLEYVIKQETHFIFLSASSTIESKVLETHLLWSKAKSYITLVSKENQEQLNIFIKAVKDNKINPELLDNFLKFMNQFPESKFIIACAELHILHKKIQTYSEMRSKVVFDPFYNITQWEEIA